jgi:hypothetical protein
MRLDNQHYTEVEILSFQARCKIDEMSYEQTVVVVTKHGDAIRLLDFMGFAVTESRLGKGKKLVLCIPYIDGDIAVLESGTPQLLENDFVRESENPSKLTLIAKIIETNVKDHDLLIDVGFGKLYLIPPDGQIERFKAGDIIKFTARRVDLLEILE